MYLKKHIRSLFSEIYLKLMHDSNNIETTVLVAGVGRSGTTWLSNTINYSKEYRYIFEPFNHVRHSESKYSDFLDFHAGLYLRPDDKNENRYELARKILSGELKDIVFDFQNVANFLNGNYKINFNKRIVKAISCNLFLKWIYHNFNEIPIILLFRHPIAVSLSRVKNGWYNVDKFHFTTFLKKRADLVSDYLMPFRDYLENIHDPFEIWVASTCIDYLVPLKQFLKGDNIYFVFYENLCLYPLEEFPKIFKHLGVDFEENKFLNLINVPQSTQKKDKTDSSSKGVRLKDWRPELNSQQLRNALSIIEKFGLSWIYSDDIKPLCSVDDLYQSLQ